MLSDPLHCYKKFIHAVGDHHRPRKNTRPPRTDANKKNKFLKHFFCILLFEGTFTFIFKDKKSKRSHKTVEIKVFLTIFAE
jgi:hypothetical protein